MSSRLRGEPNTSLERPYWKVRFSNGQFQLCIYWNGPFKNQTIPIQNMKTFGFRMCSVFKCSEFEPPLYTVCKFHLRILACLVSAHKLRSKIKNSISRNLKIWNNFYLRVTKCDFHRYGPSGTIEKVDVMCLLPQNIFSEKVFIMLWLWLITLGFLSVVYLIYLTAVVSFIPMRKSLLEVGTFSFLDFAIFYIICLIQ